MTPIDPFEHVAELRRRDHHHRVCRRRPEELAALRTLGIERHAQAVMPKNLQKLSVASAEGIEIAGMGIALEGFLDTRRSRNSEHRSYPRKTVLTGGLLS